MMVAMLMVSDDGGGGGDDIGGLHSRTKAPGCGPQVWVLPG